MITFETCLNLMGKYCSGVDLTPEEVQDMRNYVELKRRGKDPTKAEFIEKFLGSL